MKKKVEVAVLAGLIVLIGLWVLLGPGFGRKGNQAKKDGKATEAAPTLPQTPDLTALKGWLAPEAPDAAVESLPSLSYVGVPSSAVTRNVTGIVEVLPKPTAIIMTSDTEGSALIDGAVYRVGEKIRNSSLRLTAVRPQSVVVADAAGKTYVLDLQK